LENRWTKEEEQKFAVMALTQLWPITTLIYKHIQISVSLMWWKKISGWALKIPWNSARALPRFSIPLPNLELLIGIEYFTKFSHCWYSF